MNRKFASRFALITLLAVAASLPLSAQAPAPAAPTISFVQANGAIVKPSGNGLATIAVNVSDGVGLRAVFVYGANRSAGSYYAAGTKSARIGLFWNLNNAPAGNYTFYCTAFSNSGRRSDQTITLHLVK